MAEHEWKIGDWCEWNGVRRLVFDVDDEQLETVRNTGGAKSIPIGLDGLFHLPDCTGWDWQPTPKLQLREGAWYERADGKVVGPCSPGLETIPKWKFQVDSVFYDEEGVQVNRNAILDLIREVPAPAPKYRPFANAEEFKPHRDRWVTDKDGKLLGRVCTYNATACWFVGVFGEYSGNWERCFGHIIFDDTKLPFGVEVQS